MPEDQSGQLMIPRIRRAPAHEKYKIIGVIFLLVLVLVGSVMAMMIWWDTPGS